MELDTPYFMTNKEWYRFDKKKCIYILTDKAPLKAKLSYNKFYKELNRTDINDINEKMQEINKKYGYKPTK